MHQKLVVHEHTSSYWKPLIIIFAFIALLFFFLFLMVDSPLLGGVFRLVAFIGFAGAVLAFFQVQGKTRTIEVELDNKHLIVTYLLSTEKNQEELFERDTIARISEENAPAAWGILPRKQATKVEISFTDTKNTLSLFRFQGHDIYISVTDGKKLRRFLDENL